MAEPATEPMPATPATAEDAALPTPGDRAATVTIVAYYKFVPLPDYQERREPIRECCEANGVKGMILLAAEGINSTMAGPQEGVDAVLEFLQSDPAIGPLTVKSSYAAENPFHRLKVRLKKEIVCLGMPEVNPNNQVGEYVPPEKWNALISDPNLILVDTRNDYECELGTFQGAVDPRTKSFREFPEYVEKELSDKKDRPIAMFCTGGIRCEKSTAFLLQQGFQKVYHLQGGILNYLEKVDPAESMWQGDCFVFDKRVTVNHSLKPGAYASCYACRHAITAEDRASPHFVEGVSCPYCHESLTDEQRQKAAERQRQVEIHKKLNRPHLGLKPQQVAEIRAQKQAERKALAEKALARAAEVAAAAAAQQQAQEQEQQQEQQQEEEREEETKAPAAAERP